jgi:hypothetical protein
MGCLEEAAGLLLFHVARRLRVGGAGAQQNCGDR